ncbi:MAG: hypothetical protein ABI165_09545 [Bryobacteraceae bacterium]
MGMEQIFKVRGAGERGFCARTRGHAILTEADAWDEIRRSVLEAAVLHFEESPEHPRLVQLHYVKAKDGGWLGWGPMHHWTDSKIRIHAFYCMLGISLLQYLHRESRKVWPGLSMEQFLEELRQIQQFVLLYPPLGGNGPNRVATVLSKQTLAQQALAESLALNSSVVPNVGTTELSL